MLDRKMKLGILYCFSFISMLSCTASFGEISDSTKIVLATAQPAERRVVTQKSDCVTTKEQVYSVSLLSRQDANPNCPPNMIVEKINLRTENHYMVDIVTYVSLVCCPQKTDWQSTASNEKVSSAINKIFTNPPATDVGNAINKVVNVG